MPRQQTTRKDQLRGSSWAPGPRGRRSARRGKQASRKSPLASARGLLGALGRNKTSTRVKRSRQGPALLAVLGGLGAAGAAAFKRRQGTRDQPPAGPSAADATGGTETPRVESA